MQSKNSGLLGAFFATVFFTATALGADTATKLKVGLVLDKGGRDDKSFNESAFRGGKEAEKDLGIELKVVEASDDTAIEPALRTFAQHGYPLVIGIGFVQSSAIKKVAPQFPKTHFLLVDSEVDLPNVRSVIFKEHEGSFLVGALAAMVSKAQKFGFIGGMDIPLIRRFEGGYRAGVEHVRKEAKVVANYVGSTSDAWKNPTKAKELALSQYQGGAEVVFHAAGASGLGIFDAAEEKKKFAIGVDSNQNWVKPGRVLTSMIKRVDWAVRKGIEDEKGGKFTAGILHVGLAEGAVDYALDEFNRPLIPKDVVKKVDALKAQIKNKKLIVPDVFDEAAKKRG